MTEAEKLAAIEEIKRVKARYFRGVDTGDGDLVRSILAEQCELDYIGCCTDPKSGLDFMPAMNVVLRGRDKWVSDAFKKAGIVSVHQGYNPDIEILSPNSARGTWAMTDRLYMPPGAPFSAMIGYGYYHDTYMKEPSGWKLQTTRIERLRVEAI